MKKSISFLILTFVMFTLSGQSINLTFTSIDNASYIQLDSIKVINRTQGGDTVMIWPDTVLSISLVGIADHAEAGPSFGVQQNYPNPVVDRTTIKLNLPEAGLIDILLADMLGRKILKEEFLLEKGQHSFLFFPGSSNLLFFSARWQDQISTIKILNHSSGDRILSLLYQGELGGTVNFKASSHFQGFPFNPGDELLYVGYYDTLQSGMVDTPDESHSYIYQFATNIPCPGMPTVEYGGQVYNTIQICSQCWLKENLNIGKMIEAPDPQTDNDTIEKYCLINMSKFCDEWGGLYSWSEIMNYTTQSGTRGICPEGWHIPSELEWQILEGTVDSEYGIGDPVWGYNAWRGIDAGGNLKQKGTTQWQPPNAGATDAYGFTALAGGYFVQEEFWGTYYKGFFWNSGPPGKLLRNMDWNQDQIRRVTGGMDFAASVRCIKD